MQTVLAVHLAAALAAVALGAAVLFRRKGTRSHKLAGRTWVVLMAATALSSFALAGPALPHWHGLGPIHALSAFTLLSLAMAVRAVRRGDVRAHRRWIVGPYVGLVVAGLAALAPGRFLSGALFG
jgi:uncharacterized membrane protein